jgi:hypothetical protein
MFVCVCVENEIISKNKNLLDFMQITVSKPENFKNRV